jgi:hypothetical protein
MSQEDLKPEVEVKKEEVKVEAPAPVAAPVIQHVSADKFECKDGVLYKNGLASGHC